MPLVRKTGIYQITSVFVVLGGVLASRELVKGQAALGLAMTFGILYLFSKIIQARLTYLTNMLMGQMNRAVDCYLLAAVNRKLAEIDPDVALRFSKGELKTLVNSDIGAIEDFVSAAVSQIIPTVMMVIILGPTLWVISGSLGMIALGTALLGIPVSLLGAKIIEALQMKAQKQQDALTSRVGEWVRNIRLIRYLGWQPHFSKQLEELMRRFTFRQALRHAVGCMIYAVSGVWWMVPLVSMLVYAQHTNQTVDVATIFSTIWILDNLMNYLNHIQHSLSRFGTAIAGSERLAQLFHTEELRDRLRIVSRTKQLGLPAVLRFKDVSVAFGSSLALKNITVDFPLQSRVAIIGGIGAGKTTLMQLLIGDRLPTTGDIEVEFDSGERASIFEQDVYEALRLSLAYAEQKPFLSNAMLRHNIDLGTTRELVTIEDAVQHSQLRQDITMLRRGIDEEVGEVGINLSGGQKQRVSLARAFVSGRPFYILDDPLSAVDESTEQSLFDSLLQYSKGFIIASHRLKELSRCDRIITLEHGEIVEDGAPAELLAQPSSYYQSFLHASLDDHAAHAQRMLHRSQGGAGDE